MPRKRHIIDKNTQINEILKCGKDPEYFLNKYVKIQHMTRGSIHFNTYAYQDRTLKDFLNHRFNVVLKPRQMGYSTLTANYALWLTLFHRDKNALIIATKLDVAMNFIRKIKFTLANLPKWLVLPEIVADNKQTIEFSHGSKIKAIPTSDDAGRSEALSLLIVDEAAHVRKFDNLWMGLYPTISTGGRAILISTPNGVGDMYHKIYTEAEQGLNEFNTIKVSWDEHPDYDDKWFETFTKNMSKRQIAQELLCDFLTSGDNFFSSDEIEWITSTIKKPIEKTGPNRDIWIWAHPLSEHKYILSADIARGDAKDFSAAHIIDINTGEVVLEYKGKIPPDRFAELLNKLGLKYNNALICPENNSFGYATILKLKELRYPALYYRKRRGVYVGGYVPDADASIAGFTTSGKSRGMILTKLEEIVRNKELMIYSKRFLDEMKTFIWAGSKPQSMRNRNDDLIMSLAIGAWLFEASDDYGKSSSLLNDALLSGMSVTTNNYNTGQFDMNSNTEKVVQKPHPIWDAGRVGSDKRKQIREDFTNDILR